MMNYDSFSHGQILSKEWLCEYVEHIIPQHSNILILGSWYNILGFMMMSRNGQNYGKITGVDIDPSCKPIADKICNRWVIEGKMENITADANDFDMKQYDVIINCSPEHMDSNEWFENIPDGKDVCIQSSNIDIKDDEIWKCVNPNDELSDLTEKYRLRSYLFSEEIDIEYDDWGYKRFMIIGVK